MLAHPGSDDDPRPPRPEGAVHGDSAATTAALRAGDFAALYEAHGAFVWRMARRFGVPEGALEDAVQDVFVVVHHQLASFEGRSAFRTWLLGITRRVARSHRPPRDRAHAAEGAEGELAEPHERGPEALLEKAQGSELLHALLDELDDDKREAFVLAELEELSMPEVAGALGLNVNTAASRVRAARKELEQALARVRAKQRWRLP